jgi:hypothetical protein
MIGATHAPHGIVDRSPFCLVADFLEQDWILQSDPMDDGIAGGRRVPIYYLASFP